MRLPARSTTAGPRVMLLPLMDVIFLILVAFICDTLQMVVHRGVPVVLPSAVSGPVSLEDYLSVTITRDGALFLDRQPVDRQGLERALKQRLADGPIEHCFLAADRETTHGQVVAVLDLLRRLGVESVALETIDERDE